MSNLFLRNLAFTASLFWLSISPAFGKDETGWILTQKHELNGKQVLFVTATRLRVDNIDLGYSLLADAKIDKLWLFNDSKRLMYSMPLKDYRNMLSTMFIAIGENPAPLKWTIVNVAPPRQFAPLNLLCYETSEEKTYFSGSKKGGFLAGKKRFATARHRLFLTSKIGTDKRLLKVIFELQGGPKDASGMPIYQESWFSDSKEVRIRLNTLEYRLAPIDQKKWSAPSYKVAAHQNDVSGHNSTGVEELVGN